MSGEGTAPAAEVEVLGGGDLLFAVAVGVVLPKAAVAVPGTGTSGEEPFVSCEGLLPFLGEVKASTIQSAISSRTFSAARPSSKAGVIWRNP